LFLLIRFQSLLKLLQEIMRVILKYAYLLANILLKPKGLKRHSDVLSVQHSRFITRHIAILQQILLSEMS